MFGDTFKTVKSLSESVYQVPKKCSAEYSHLSDQPEWDL